jgi:hypothetical protein
MGPDRKIDPAQDLEIAERLVETLDPQGGPIAGGPIAGGPIAGGPITGHWLPA